MMRTLGWDKLRGALRLLSREDSGMAAVELALVAPVLILVLLSMFEYGVLYTRKMTLASAARAGTQFAMIQRPVQGDLTLVQQATENALPVDFDKVKYPPSVQLLCECPPGGVSLQSCATIPACAGGDAPMTYVQVQIRETVPMIFYPKSLNFDETSLMRLN